MRMHLPLYGWDTKPAAVEKTLISDDTQMTLFTANGLLWGTTRGKTRGIMGSYPSYIAYCYKEWYRTRAGSHHQMPCAGRQPFRP